MRSFAFGSRLGVSNAALWHISRYHHANSKEDISFLAGKAGTVRVSTSHMESDAPSVCTWIFQETSLSVRCAERKHWHCRRKQ